MYVLPILRFATAAFWGLVDGNAMTRLYVAIASSKRPAFWALWAAARSCCTSLDGLGLCEGFDALLEGSFDGSFADVLEPLAVCCERACWPEQTSRMPANIRQGGQGLVRFGSGLAQGFDLACW